MANDRSATLPPLRVLLVEDDPADALLTRRAMAGRSGVDVDVVDTLADALTRLRVGGYHAVLLDLGLPDASGLGGLERLTSQFPEIPVVVLTGTTDAELGLRAVGEGAQDFMAKDALDGVRLEVSLRYAVQRHDWQQVLIAQAEALQRANARLVDFAGIVAHDLRAPLATAHQLAQFIASRAGDIEGIPDAGSRLEAVVRHGLQMVEAHLESHGEGRVERRTLDLHTLVTEAVSALEPGSASVVVRPLPVVDASPGALRAVLQNLLRNAVVHAGPSPRVEVSARAVPQGWLVSVEDDGPGVPASLREAVFEGGHRSTASAGWGLGLTGVRRAIEAHGGVVWMDTGQLGGAAVRFVLPGPPRAEVRTER